MGLEAATYVSNLVTTNPVGGSDPKSQGDDHIRLIKTVLRNSFPNISGAMTATHTELNDITNKYLKSGGAITGNMTISGTLGVSGATTLAALTASGTLTANGTTNLAGTVNSTGAGGVAISGGPLLLTGRAARFAAPVTVAHAGTTLNVPLTSNIIQVTGAGTTITHIDSASPKIFVAYFSSVLTLSHSANLLLPGAASIVTALNDRAIFFQVDASSNNWMCFYQRSATAP